MPGRKRYSREFKLEAIELWESSSKSAAEVEEELGLSRGRLYEWKSKLKAQGEQTLQSRGRSMTVEEENRRLRRELKIAVEERDILKKVVAIFSGRKP